MRVLFVANGFPPRGQWGTEFYTGQLAKALSGAGHTLAAFVPDRSGARPRYTLEEESTESARLFVLHNSGDPKKRFLSSYQDPEVDRAFAAVLERWRPDLVHFNYLLWGLSLGMVREARARNIATVATLTDYGLLCHRGQMVDWRIRRCGGPRPAEDCARCIRRHSIHDGGVWTRTAHRLAGDGLAALGGFGLVPTTADLRQRESAVGEVFGALDRVIAPTDVLARAFLGAGLPKERVVPLVYGFDERPYHGARAEPPRPLRFGYLGQLTPHKGVDVLLDAVEIAATRLPESVEAWTVHLWGSEAGHRHRRYGPRLRARARPGRVVFEPAFAPDEAPSVLARLHAIAVPSLWDENAPLVCLQARAAGVPVLASDVAGVREVLTHGEHGILVPPSDALALADAMREVILGRVTRHPSPSIPMDLAEHTRRVLAVYEDAIAAARSRRA